MIHKTPTLPKLLLFLLLGLVVMDRIFTLQHFGFLYTDIDQVILWNGAIDYAQGNFYEPYFYGQAYNFMLESLLAVPLIWMNIPVNEALPIVTSFLTLLPYVVLAFLFFKKKQFFWAYFVLAFPLFLPLDFQLLTTLPRGFVQAYLFLPLLFLPLFWPQHKFALPMLFIGTGLCFIANPSSILITLPLFVFIASSYFKEKRLYLNALWMIPILFLGQLASYFYQLHPKRIRHELVGLKLDAGTFKASFGNQHLFENLFPFVSLGGFLYPLLFLALAVIAWKKGKKKAFVLIVSTLIVLLFSMAVPKFQEGYEGAGIFFTSSRLYLSLPLLFLLSLFFTFENRPIKPVFQFLVMGIALLSVILRNDHLDEKIGMKVENIVFPISKNEELLKRTDDLVSIASKYNVDVIVNQNEPGWDYLLDIETYAFHALRPDFYPQLICLRLLNDRRSWLYTPAMKGKTILLNGMTLSDSLLKPFDSEILSPNQVVIKNNQLPLDTLFVQLERKFGLTFNKH
ncbi:MAG: hypothetical protein WC044_07595 [Crocinitomicaceae bacterium]